jgi:uncharacterized membrane protein YbhN (UPF0104 family)
MAIKLVVSAALLSVLLARVDLAALWAGARGASVAWLGAALAVYLANVVASAWRWGVLLDAQHVRIPRMTLLSSYLVAGFFNNFLPSNIGGDVVRIRDTARAAGSKTLAATVVTVDRGLGLMGLILVAAIGATLGARSGESSASPIWPAWLWVGFAASVAIAAPAVITPSGLARLLRPFAAVHPEWALVRIDRLTQALERFRKHPRALAVCFGGAVTVQVLLLLYHVAVVYALGLPIGLWDLAVIVPVSLFVQTLPISINGFGVREAAFSFYLTRVGLTLESAMLLPLVATALMMLFSLTGALVYVTRRSRSAAPGRSS